MNSDGTLQRVGRYSQHRSRQWSTQGMRLLDRADKRSGSASEHWSQLPLVLEVTAGYGRRFRPL